MFKGTQAIFTLNPIAPAGRFVMTSARHLTGEICTRDRLLPDGDNVPKQFAEWGRKWQLFAINYILYLVFKENAYSKQYAWEDMVFKSICHHFEKPLWCEVMRITVLVEDDPNALLDLYHDTLHEYGEVDSVQSIEDYRQHLKNEAKKRAFETNDECTLSNMFKEGCETIHRHILDTGYPVEIETPNDTEEDLVNSIDELTWNCTCRDGISLNLDTQNLQSKPQNPQCPDVPPGRMTK